VSYSSSSTNISLSGNVVTILGAGTATITASQVGDANYNAAANVNKTLTVLTAPTLGAFTNLTKVYGDAAFTLKAPTSSSAGVWSFISDSTNVATLSNTTVTIKGAGTAVITATQAASGNWSSAATNATLTVTKASNTIAAFTAIAAKTYSTSPVVFTVPTATSKLPVTVTVLSGPGQMLDTNKVSLTGAGTVTLAANQPGNSNYLAATQVTTSFTVAKATQTIAAFTAITNRPYSTSPVVFTIPTATSKLPVTVTVLSGPAVTNTSNSLSLTGAGTVTLAANQPGNSGFAPAPQVTTSFTVAKASQTITNFVNLTNTYGALPVTLSATASSGLPVSYSSTNKNISLSNNVVTILGAGTATITASQSGNTNYNAATSVARTLTVNKAAQTINFNPTSPLTFVSNNTFALSATCTSGTNVTFASKSTNILTISGTTATMKAKGTGTVTATAPATPNYNAATNTHTITLQ
jgi:hypothetical protein